MSGANIGWQFVWISAIKQAMIQPSQTIIPEESCHSVRMIMKLSFHRAGNDLLVREAIYTPGDLPFKRACRRIFYHSQAGESFCCDNKILANLEKSCQRNVKLKNTDKIHQNSHEICQNLAKIFIECWNSERDFKKNILLRGQILTKTSSCAFGDETKSHGLCKFLSCFYEESILRCEKSTVTKWRFFENFGT